MSDTRIPGADQGLEEIARLADLPQQEVERRPQIIVRNIKELKRINLLTRVSTGKTDQVLICELAVAENESFQIWIYQIKFNDVIDEVAKIVVR